MIRSALLALTLSLVALPAGAQTPSKDSATLAAWDPQCLDLYDALEACTQIETEEQACEDVDTADDLPFNNVQALLGDWPERYGAQKTWFGYCRKACRGQAKTDIRAFAEKVCHTTLPKP